MTSSDRPVIEYLSVPIARPLRAPRVADIADLPASSTQAREAWADRPSGGKSTVIVERVKICAPAAGAHVGPDFDATGIVVAPDTALSSCDVPGHPADRILPSGQIGRAHV